MNPNHKAYTVCFLFTDDLELVLLQKKAKTDFKDMLNGVGGKMEPGETPAQCAIREIKEETGVSELRSFTWLGTLSLPYNCDTHAENTDPDDPACILHFFAGVLYDKKDINMEASQEESLYLIPVDKILSNDCVMPLAGDGDMQYFVKQALHTFTYKTFVTHHRKDKE